MKSPIEAEIKQIAQAHTNISMLDMIAEVIDGYVRGGENKTADRIRDLCIKERNRQCKIMDKHVAAITATKGEKGGAA